MEAIKMEGLSKAYGEIQAVKNLSLSVEQGEIFGLLGANGAGKSTTMECMLGTLKLDSWTVAILGMNPRTQRKELFEQVGVQFQEANYQEKITVGELCQVTAALYEKSENYKELLLKFGMPDKEKSLVSELWGGQKQRLFIVLSLIPNPRVVFLDELTTGLDVKARRDVWKVLQALKEKGLKIFLTSHFMDEIQVTPTSPTVILAVQVAIYALYSLVSLALVYLAASLLFGFQMSGSWLPFPMLIFSGATLPYEVMPEVLQRIANVMPLTQGIKLLKSASLGLSASYSMAPLVIMAVLAVICIAVPLRCFRWE